MEQGICHGAALPNCPNAPAATAVPGPAAAPAVSPQQVAQQAEAEIQLTAPALQLSPDTEIDPQAKQIVNAPTWAWLPAGAWAPLQATATAGPVVVRAVATPVSINVAYTDGGEPQTATCHSAGTPFSAELADEEDPDAPLSAASPDCGWTFHDTSSSAPGGVDPIKATVTYDVTWTVQGALGGGDLGPLTSPATTYQVPVAEIEILNTN